MKLLTTSASSINLLTRLIVAHLFGSLFAHTVYIKFTQLGDRYLPEYYLQYIGTRDISEFNSTALTYSLYYILSFVFPSFIAPMFMSVIIAILTWVTFRDIYKYVNQILFWICNLLPHFLIWSGSSSKEQIIIVASLVVINFVAKRSFSGKKLNINLIFVLIALLIIFIFKPNYFVMYFIIFITALFSPWLNKIFSERISFGVWVFVLTFALILCLSLTSIFFNDEIIKYMEMVEWQFLALEGGTNRLDIEWKDKLDFLLNSFWAMPQGFIGPTLLESISKPILFPVFLEGLFHFSILLILLVKLLDLSLKSRELRVHILPYIFVCFAIIFVSYPWLMFNPGSALRYKQSMHPILTFYPLLILAYYRANELKNFYIKKYTDDTK